MMIIMLLNNKIMIITTVLQKKIVLSLIIRLIFFHMDTPLRLLHGLTECIIKMLNTIGQ